jgi:hypothetical protein
MGHHQDHRVAPSSRLTRSGPAVAALGVGASLVALFLTAIVLLFSASVGASATTVGSVCHADGDASEIPARYRPLYATAATRYRLGRRGPAILASIHKHESGFGQNMGPSSAGAIGHMQFMPATWAAYGVDADRDGTADPHNPADAIHGAANYLNASGAPADWAGALFSYNHADWYVRMILDGAEGFQGLCDQPTGTPAELGDLPADPLERIIRVASWIDQGHHPYCWGGGHATKPGPSTGTYCWTSADTKAFGTTERGLDCSGAVRWLLVLTGYKDPGGIVSGSFDDVYPRGRGRVITIWSNAAHVFIEVHGKGFWGTTQTNYRHGPGWISSYPTAGFAASHPTGL